MKTNQTSKLNSKHKHTAYEMCDRASDKVLADATLFWLYNRSGMWQVTETRRWGILRPAIQMHDNFWSIFRFPRIPFISGDDGA